MTDLTIPAAERLVGRPLDQWDGRCHLVSTMLAQAVGGVVHRGYYLGPKVEGAFFHGAFSQHSWIALPDGTVVDPTRHAFDLSPRWPLWRGPADEYDVGGCKSQPPSGPPASRHGDEKLVAVTIEQADLNETGLGFTLPAMPAPMLTRDECAWLAHLPVKDQPHLGAMTKDVAERVYRALIDAGQGELIAIDRRAWVLGDFESTAELAVRFGGAG
jgi:hypothetical protein